MSALFIALFIASPAEMRDAPRDPPSLARIAPETEPGQPLAISGTVYAPDGQTPAPGVIVYAYHTDANGLYRPDKRRDLPPRLRGWARTDAHGRFEFRTIRPAPYPGREVPAHVHFQLWGAGYPRQWTEDLHTDTCDGGRCTFDIRLRAISNFK